MWILQISIALALRPQFFPLPQMKSETFIYRKFPWTLTGLELSCPMGLGLGLDPMSSLTQISTIGLNWARPESFSLLDPIHIYNFRNGLDFHCNDVHNLIG